MIIGIVSETVTILAYAQSTENVSADFLPFGGLANSSVAYFAPFNTPDVQAMLRMLISNAEKHEDAGTELFVQNFLNCNPEERQIHCGSFLHEVVLCGQDKM